MKPRRKVNRGKTSVSVYIKNTTVLKADYLVNYLEEELDECLSRGAIVEMGLLLLFEKYPEVLKDVA